MFDIVFQKNLSETMRLDKNLITITTLSGVLKERSSIVNPTLLVECDIATLSQANYLTIATFGRAYFINEIASVRNSLVEVSCRVDVLSSFKNEIRGNSGIVRRQENEWNLYLNDGVLEVYQNPHVTTHVFPTGFSGQSYVLALAGRRGTAASVAGSGTNPTGGGSASGVKTPSGLYTYAMAQVGKPYWMGTFGQTADAALYANRKAAYPKDYTDADYPDQYGQRVHDCVGLIKGYRWSETPTSTPVYVISEDVNVSGLYGQCSIVVGELYDYDWEHKYKFDNGIVLFNRSLTHCGVSEAWDNEAGTNFLIEARGHSYGVQYTRLDAPGRTWQYYGVPDWMFPSIDTGEL